MTTGVNFVGRHTTLEAVPRDRRPRWSARAAERDRPGGHDELRGGSARTPELGRGRLPRVLQGVRVLVVDDDEDTVELFAVVLTACGAEVVTATSASAAMRLMAERAPDVVLADIAMPEADGYWLVREIRGLADARMRAVPVVAVTAFGREHSRTRALEAGFYDRLEKPVDPELLCLTVARARGL
jgi:CheY-like chemotaxis protein